MFLILFLNIYLIFFLNLSSVYAIMAVNWTRPKLSTSVIDLLKKSMDIKIPNIDKESIVDELIQKSEKFPVKFPIDTTRLKSLRNNFTMNELASKVMSTYPLIHERVLILMAEFLLYKRSFGSNVEKKLYASLSIETFVDRLLSKRSVVFMGANDDYKLLSGETGKGGWENVGKMNEKLPLILENCLSYDEMKISAMLYVSGNTVFINDGSRSNNGIPDKENIEENGVIIGSIGTRLEKEFLMDWQDMVVDQRQNTEELGYGPIDESPKSRWVRMWSNFYQTEPVLYSSLDDKQTEHGSQADKQTRFTKLCDGRYFDNEVYAKRLIIPFDAALFDADMRGEQCGRNAYLNIIGIGLGVWKISSHQNDLFVLAFVERLKQLLDNNLLDKVANVNFSYIKISKRIEDIIKKNQKMTSRNGGHTVLVTSENRNPSSKLNGSDRGKLLVTIYPWDGNAHPGNEFWLGSLNGSGDPAAACSSQVAELHNAHINARFVSGGNLRVCGKSGVKHISDYVRQDIESC